MPLVQSRWRSVTAISCLAGLVSFAPWRRALRATSCWPCFSASCAITTLRIGRIMIVTASAQLDHGAGRDHCSSIAPSRVLLTFVRLLAARRRLIGQRLHDAGRRFPGPCPGSCRRARRFSCCSCADDIYLAELFRAGRGRQRLRPVHLSAISAARSAFASSTRWSEPGAGHVAPLVEPAAGRDIGRRSRRRPLDRFTAADRPVGSRRRATCSRHVEHAGLTRRSTGLAAARAFTLVSLLAAP